MKLVVDSNILIAALIKDSMCRHILFHSDAEFLTISITEKEIQKYKHVVLQKARITEDDFDLLMEKMLRSYCSA